MPGLPKRFAQAIGVTFTVTASVLWPSGATGAARIVIALLLGAAFLEAAFGFASGAGSSPCWMRRGHPSRACAKSATTCRCASRLRPTSETVTRLLRAPRATRSRAPDAPGDRPLHRGLSRSALCPSPRALRLIMVKADGCVAIHADGGAYKPLNWMNGPQHDWSTTSDHWIGDRTPRVRSHDPPAARCIIRHAARCSATDPGLRRTVSRPICRSCWLRRPDMRSRMAFALVRREYPTAIGPVDLVCRDVGRQRGRDRGEASGDIDGVEQPSLRYIERHHRRFARCGAYAASSSPQVREAAGEGARRITGRGMGRGRLRRGPALGAREADLTLFLTSAAAARVPSPGIDDAMALLQRLLTTLRGGGVRDGRRREATTPRRPSGSATPTSGDFEEAHALYHDDAERSNWPQVRRTVRRQGDLARRCARAHLRSDSLRGASPVQVTSGPPRTS